MEIATKGDMLIKFSPGSLLPVNPMLDSDYPRILSRTRRDDKERYGVMVAPKKHKCSHEKDSLVKRQKKTMEVDSTTTKAISRMAEASLLKTTSKAKQEAKTKSVGATAFTTRVTKPENSVRPLKVCLHRAETKKPDGTDLRNLIAKARQKIQEKRQINHRCSEITRNRIAARLALNQVVATVEFENHLKYHWELEQLGYSFIHDQVDCLNMFSFLSRSDYNDESNYSVLEKNKVMA